MSDAAPEEEEAIGWMFPSSGGARAQQAMPSKHANIHDPSNDFLLFGSSIADDLSHDTKKGSIARAQEGINSKGNIFDI